MTVVSQTACMYIDQASHIHTSSVGPIPETAVFDPVSPYGASKVAAENLATQYFRSYHIPVSTALQYWASLPCVF